MAKKQRKIYSLDMGVVEQFEKICKKKDTEFSAAVQGMMEHWIAKDGELTMDDLYAPRISGLVKRTVQDEVDRIAKMLYNINVDVTANLYAIPAMYKKNLKSVEHTFNHYLDERVLNPKRVSAAEQFNYAEDGQKIIADVRNFARNDIKQRKKMKED